MPGRGKGADILFALVFTKVDKLSAKKAQPEVNGAEPLAVMTSAKTREGSNELLAMAHEAMHL